KALAMCARIGLALHDAAALDDVERAVAAWSALLEVPAWQRAAHAALVNLAIVESRLALDDLGGLEHAAERLAHAERLLADEPALEPEADGALIRVKLATARGNLELRREQFAAAAQQFAVADTLLGSHRLAELHPDLRAHQLLGAGTAALKQGGRKRALELFTAARAAVAAAGDRFPSDADLQRTRAAVHLQLGVLRLLQRRHADAIADLEVARTTWEALLARTAAPPVRDEVALAVSCTQLGNCYMLQQPPQSEPARQLYTRALAIQQRLLETHPGVAAHVTELAATHSDLAAWENTFGEPAAARRHARAAIELQERARAERPDLPRITQSLAIHNAQLAYAERRLGDGEAALAAARRAIELDPTHAATVRICAEVAVAIAAGLGEPDATDRLHGECVGWLRGLTLGTASGIGHLLARRSFDPLRQRADFRELVREVGR
ncbi:MAG: hypothetical protein KDE27_25725, partial [Planctomycetes bacterium]|nr:hypothetical protein [Planctomycetota bacterium]